MQIQERGLAKLERFTEQPLFSLDTGNDIPGPWEEEDLARQADFQARASAAGADFKEMALHYLIKARARILDVRTRICDCPVDAVIEGDAKRKIIVLSRGTPDDSRTAGLRREDTVLKVGFFGMQLGTQQRLPVVIVTSHLPKRDSASGRCLAMMYPKVTEVATTTGDFVGFQRLSSLLHERSQPTNLRAPWREAMAPRAQMTFDGLQDGADDVVHDARELRTDR